MTTLRAATSTVEDRITNSKVLFPWSALIAPEFASALIEANGYLFYVNENRIFVSEDGISFYDTGYDTGGTKIRDITYGNDKYVAVGESALILSSLGPDAQKDWNWTLQDPPAEFVGDYEAITFGEGFFMAAGNDGGGSGIIHRSANGALWLVCTVDSNVDAFLDIEYGSGNFVAVGLYSPEDTVGVIQLTTAPDVAFENQTPADLPDGWGVDWSINVVHFTGTHFVISGPATPATGAEQQFLQQAETGVAWEDITDRLATPDIAWGYERTTILAPTKPVILSHKGNLFILQYNSNLQISDLGEDGPDNFRNIPLDVSMYKGFTRLGDNFYMAPIAGIYVSQPFIPIPPAPVV
jgi:hypothetical protein